MRRTVAGFWWSPTAQGTPALVVTAAFFTLGGLAGCLLALGAAEGGAQALQAYLDSFLAAAQTGSLEVPALSTLLWRTLRWPLAAFLLGFTALGLLGVPVLTALRSFFLAFSIASFAQAYGRDGLCIAFLLLGLPGVLELPAFFLLSVQSLSAAYSLAVRNSGQGRRDIPYGRDYWLRCGVCAALIGIGFLVERFLTPALLTGAAGILAQ